MKIILQVFRIKVTPSKCLILQRGILILGRSNFDLLLQKLLESLGGDGSSDTWKPKSKVWHIDHII